METIIPYVSDLTSSLPYEWVAELILCGLITLIVLNIITGE